MADKVQNIKTANSFSIAWFSRRFEVSRDSVRRRIEGLKPSGEVNGYPVYKMADVAKRFYLKPKHSRYDVNSSDYSAREELLYYKAQLAKLKYEKLAGQLLEVEAVQATMSRMCKEWANTINLLPDLIERDAGLTAEQFDALERVLDDARAVLHMRLVEHDLSERAGSTDQGGAVGIREYGRAAG